jgi:adenosylcobinamide-GDP ribazoletransferase
LAGVRLAVTTLTVVPLRAGPVDRAAAGVAMALAPPVGLLLGALAAAAGLGLRALGAPASLAGVGAVAVGVLLTRGLHLDGLADTVDGLGAYRDRDATLEVMRKPDIGPFGVVAIVLALAIQAASAAAILTRTWPAALAAIAVAVGTGRLAASWACRNGVPAARPDGLGAVVAGTVGWPVALGALAAVALVAVPAVPGRPWQGPVAVAVALAATLALTRHAVRRLGGITGDVLGACVEVAATVAYLVLALVSAPRA